MRDCRFSVNKKSHESQLGTHKINVHQATIRRHVTYSVTIRLINELATT